MLNVRICHHHSDDIKLEVRATRVRMVVPNLGKGRCYKHALTVISSAHCKSSRNMVKGLLFDATAPMILQNMNFSLRLDPMPLVAFKSTLWSVSLPPLSHFCNLGRALILPDPMASWMRHFNDIREFPGLDSTILPKKESIAEARTVSGRTCLLNFPSIKYPFKSSRGFLI